MRLSESQLRETCTTFSDSSTEAHAAAWGQPGFRLLFCQAPAGQVCDI